MILELHEVKTKHPVLINLNKIEAVATEEATGETQVFLESEGICKVEESVQDVKGMMKMMVKVFNLTEAKKIQEQFELQMKKAQEQFEADQKAAQEEKQKTEKPELKAVK